MLRKCKKCNGGVSSVVESWPGSAALVGGWDQFRPRRERKQGGVTERTLPPAAKCQSQPEQTTGESSPGNTAEEKHRADLPSVLGRCQNWSCALDGEKHGVLFRKLLTCWKGGDGGRQVLRMSRCRKELLLVLFLPNLASACKRVSRHLCCWWGWFTVNTIWDSLESPMTTRFLWLSYCNSIHTIFLQTDSSHKFNQNKFFAKLQCDTIAQGPAHRSSVVVRHLPKDVTLPLAEHQSLEEGELLYARFKVPASSGSLTALVNQPQL